MQTCSTCRHWQTPCGWHGADWAGACLLAQGNGYEGLDAFYVTTEGSDKGDLLTGPDFGCVKHAPSYLATQAHPFV
jgi:hypothetical protein